MKRYIIFFIYSFLYIINFKTFGQNSIVFSNSLEKIQIGNNIEILEDSTNVLSIDKVLISPYFKKSKEEVPNFQISNSSFWAKFRIKNVSKNNSLVLELPYPIIDKVDFYKVLPSGEFIHETSGENIPCSERKYNHQNYIFDLNISENETATFLIKVKGSEQMQLPIIIGTSKSVLEDLLTKDLIFGLYAGLILVMFLYNLFIYYVVKDFAYLYYVAYILTVGVTQACLQGYSFKYIWPTSEYIANQSMILSPSLAGIGALLFVNIFLQVKKYTPILYKFSIGLVFIYGISISLGFFELYTISQQIVQLNAMLGSILVFIITYRIIKKGVREANFFLIAWSIFLASVIIFVLRNFDFLPYNNLTYYALQIGSGLEVILLSFALADRINILKREKESSQAEVLNALRENERIIKEQNILLEGKVEERTSALTKSNNELSTTLSELKQTQSQLVNAEKMASLGQLTAGIAHEINNPINFVVSNVKPLRRDINDIYELVRKYEEICNEETEKYKEVNSFRKNIDYDYIKEEISNLLKGIEEGASRTAEIVKGLRAFSRLDETDLKKINLIDGIESTLILLNTEILGSINLVKNYSEIPPIECYPGKINQVFMNIINNAIYAIKDNKGKTEKGILTISTTSDNNFVKISIKDNGIGMTDEIKQKVFEPFFTTKDVGKGTGLGMSITFSIIKDHNGSIEINSEVGEGTEFIIILPINQKSR